MQFYARSEVIFLVASTYLQDTAIAITPCNTTYSSLTAPNNIIAPLISLRLLVTPLMSHYSCLCHYANPTAIITATCVTASSGSCGTNVIRLLTNHTPALLLLHQIITAMGTTRLCTCMQCLIPFHLHVAVMPTSIVWYLFTQERSYIEY